MQHNTRKGGGAILADPVHFHFDRIRYGWIRNEFGLIISFKTPILGSKGKGSRERIKE
jgi:hypothetical protein